MEIMDFGESGEREAWLGEIARWHQKEWAHLNPGQTLEMRMDKMRGYWGDAPVPRMYVGVDAAGKPVATAALVENDMDSHPEWTPWLASVFVQPANRRTGMGTAVVRRVVEAARDAGAEWLYLFTPDRADFYATMGWEIIGQEVYRCEEVTVMKYRIGRG